MLLRAATLLTMLDEPLSPGCVRVEGEEIVEIGESLAARPGEEVLNLDRHVLMPGMINAHCHLDYTSLRGAIFPGKNFTTWIQRINSMKASLSPEDYLESIREGIRLHIQSGCTTILNVASFPDLILRLEPPPLRIWWFLEFIDIRQRITNDELLAGALHFFDDKPGWLGGFGLSPHAPYTASTELYRLARQCSEQLDMQFTTHIAESVDEQEMFLYARGSLYEFLQSIGRDMGDCGHGSALSHLFDHGAISDRCIAVHMNYLQEYDFEFLSTTRLPVVHCPKCHAYFGHARFPLERLCEVGCRISLGTDSLASNDTLDLRAEIRMARREYPGITQRDWLAMVTTQPARALGLREKIGSIRVGAWADLAAFHLPERTDPYEAVIRSTEPPAMLMVNGNLLIHPTGEAISS